MEVSFPNIKLQCETPEIKTGMKTTYEQAKRFAPEEEETYRERRNKFKKSILA